MISTFLSGAVTSSALSTYPQWVCQASRSTGPVDRLFPAVRRAAASRSLAHARMHAMTTPAGADAVHELLLTHADRAVTGPLEDPAVVAAVVGIERLVVATGSTDPRTLRAAVTGQVVPGSDAGQIAELVAEARSHVAAGLIRRDSGQAVDAGVVNPASGGYEITTDATLLRAAVRAAP